MGGSDGGNVVVELELPRSITGPLLGRSSLQRLGRGPGSAAHRLLPTLVASRGWALRLNSRRLERGPRGLQKGIVQVTSVGHAGFLIQTQAGSILCDPWVNP